jgi:hypothetical protein
MFTKKKFILILILFLVSITCTKLKENSKLIQNEHKISNKLPIANSTFFPKVSKIFIYQEDNKLTQKQNNTIPNNVTTVIPKALNVTNTTQDIYQPILTNISVNTSLTFTEDDGYNQLRQILHFDYLLDIMGITLGYFKAGYLDIVKRCSEFYYGYIIQPNPYITDEVNKGIFVFNLVTFISPDNKIMVNNTIVPIIQLLSFMALIIILIYVLKKLLFTKSSTKDDFLQIDESIALKGRGKKMPNNINYSELFRGKKCKKKNKEAKEEHKDCHNDLDVFMEKIKEKEEVMKILDGRVENSNMNCFGQYTAIPVSNTPNETQILSSDFKGDLLVFEKDLDQDDLYNKRSQETIALKLESVKEVASQHEEDHEGNDCPEQGLEDNTLTKRLQNRNIFSYTPLTCINKLNNKFT